MRYRKLTEVLQLYRRIIEQSGGSMGIQNLHALESALAQPRMTFGGEDLYPSHAEKAAALAFSLIKNHPFVDGNPNESAMPLSGNISCPERFRNRSAARRQEKIILQVAAGELGREGFTAWVGAMSRSESETWFYLPLPPGLGSDYFFNPAPPSSAPH